MQLKYLSYVATNVCSRKFATAFGYLMSEVFDIRPNATPKEIMRISIPDIKLVIITSRLRRYLPGHNQLDWRSIPIGNR